jgi:RES domain-containing protein
MLTLEQLRIALPTLEPIGYKRNVFRCVELAALIGEGIRKIEPLFDLGPRRSGQRYTPIGGARALYVSEQQSTSYVESTGMFDSVSSQRDAPVAVILQFRVDLDAVLDLTLEPNQNALNTSREELTSSWEYQMATGKPVPTQILGQAAFDCGRFQALRFPSARVPQELNLLIWTERITHPSFVESTDQRFYQRIP